MSRNADWIAVDWGTSNVRAWAMEGDRPLETAAAPKGMASLRTDEFEPTLIELIGGWLAPGRVTDVVACGMVGARQGWKEAGYASVPGPAFIEGALVRPDVSDPRIRVHIVHGLSQRQPADVMRGEETQIAGLLADRPRFTGMVCLPGTHSKWVQLEAGTVHAFTSFMTGELFDLLANQSVLHHSVEDDGWSQADFESGVRAALQAPQSIASRLFSLRAESLLGDASPGAARSCLSGLLIGQELAGALSRSPAGPVVLVGAGRMVALYAAALALEGVETEQLAGEKLTLAGLTAVHRSIRRTDEERS
ncbi:2-dehydro-3-deoxygalactonokinase [Pararhizobium haloflavum]|uniref:2-dehydro-3-deoxygalactonokinase n=1 Tax=Pararhizobium haloflavum TaxID=2037914 RepID=UPI000C1A33A7|nr:2-dehydro-3-deoxygalactonokinase [Pararhizobium haloflavum]